MFEFKHLEKDFDNIYVTLFVHPLVQQPANLNQMLLLAF